MLEAGHLTRPPCGQDVAKWIANAEERIGVEILQNVEAEGIRIFHACLKMLLELK